MYLNKAIEYLIIREALQPCAWNEIAKLLPFFRPQPCQKDNPTCNNELLGLEAIAYFKYLLFWQVNKNAHNPILNVNTLNSAFEYVQTHFFPITASYETARISSAGLSNSANRKNRNTACGYPEGVGISGYMFEGKYRITGEASDSKKYHGFCDIELLEELPYKNEKTLDTLLDGEYFNGVDHFFTNLIWLIVSGVGGGDAYSKARTPGLLFSFVDCGIYTPNNSDEFNRNYVPGNYFAAKDYPLGEMRNGLH